MSGLSFAILSSLVPARVAYTPPQQFLFLDQAGVIDCPTEANPPLQFVEWRKDNQIFDPNNFEDIKSLTNGSLLISLVGQPLLFSFILLFHPLTTLLF